MMIMPLVFVAAQILLLLLLLLLLLSLLFNVIIVIVFSIKLPDISKNYTHEHKAYALA